MAVPMKRYLRKKNLHKSDSPELYYLRQEPGSYKTYTIERLASKIETSGALTQEDVVHAIKSFIRQLREVLIEGDKVKVDGLGIFHITTTCEGAATEKDCTVKNIRRVNLRFMVDNSLRLVNDAVSNTRSAPNNVAFYIKGEKTVASPDGGGEGEGEDPSV